MRCQTLQPQTILYTLPPSGLVYKGVPLPPAVVKLDLPQHLPGDEGFCNKACSAYDNYSVMKRF